MTIAEVRSTFSQPVITAASISSMAKLGDVLFVMLTGYSVYALYVGWDLATLPEYTAALVIRAALTYLLFQRVGLYRFECISEINRQCLFKVVFWCLFVFLLMTLAGAALKITAEFSRVWFFASLFLSAVTICGFRAVLCWKINEWGRSGRFTQRFAVYGATPQAKALLHQFTEQHKPWLHFAGLYDDCRKRLKREHVDLPNRVGGLEKLVSHVRSNQIDYVLVALPWSDDQHVLEVTQKLKELPVHVALVTDLIGFRLNNPEFQTFLGIPMLRLATRPMEGWSVVVKALMDRVIAAILLVLASPLLIAIAVAIRLDSPGPVLFKQRRHGFNSEEIDILKFRSMSHRDVTEKHVPQATEHDPRVTRVGQFIRHSSLDELPQLLNVLDGSMSLVGPRPHAVQHNDLYASLISGYNIRHKIKPGITGWAQVCGYRGETKTIADMKARVEHDTYYIENWSVWLDLKILFMTLGVLFHKNAY